MTSESPTDLEAVMLLCDSAQSVGGKLYILGGGWSQLSLGGAPPGGSPMGLAIKLAIPWSRANETFPIVIRLVTDQGEQVSAPNGEPVLATTDLEVGRPAGLKHGTPLDAVLALNFLGLPLGAGGYSWQLEVRDDIKARVPFRVNP